MNMKKKIIICFLAILTGFLLAFPVLFYKIPRKEDSISFYVLQVGVYEDYQNALEKKEQFMDAVIYPDDNYYRVLVGASTTKENLEKIKISLEEQNIEYYEKELKLVSDEKESFSSYNLLLDKAKEKEIILLLNQKILEKMSEL